MSDKDVEILIEKEQPSTSKGADMDKQPPIVTAKKRSPIYDYFTLMTGKDGKVKWKCNLCNQKLAKAKDTGTGSLLNHLKSKHPNRHAEFRNKQMQQQKEGLLRHVTAIPSVTEETKPEEYTFEGFKQRLIAFIIVTDQPFSLVEEDTFSKLLDFVGKCNSTMKLPSRETIRDWIRQMYTQEKDGLIKTLMDNPSKVSFSLDGWSSSNQYSFQGVVAHWIDDDWKLKTAVLDLSILEGSHSGENLALSFGNVISQYGLWKKMLAITTDNASNMTKLYEFVAQNAEAEGLTFDPENYRVRCMAHIINLSCQAALKYIDQEYSTIEEDELVDDDTFDEDAVETFSTLKKLRTSIKSIRWSPQRREVLFQQCSVAKIPNKNVILDVKTRWNSTLDMLVRALELRGPLSLTLQMNRKTQKLILSDDEWQKIEQMIELLLPFKEATVLMSSSSVPRLADTVVNYSALFDHLDKYLDSATSRTSYRDRRHQESEPVYPGWLRQSAKAAWEKLKEYYPTADGLVYSVATVLDPRFKLQWYSAAGWRSQWISDARRAVKTLWNNVYKPKSATNNGNEDDLLSEEPPTKKKKVSSIEDRINQQLLSIQGSSVQDELTKYLSEPLVPASALVKSKDGKSGFDGVLGWWKVKQHDFPNLSRMARDYLAISGTGVPVERLFSSATDLLSQRRQSMNADTIQECLCLKYWLRSVIEYSFSDLIQLKAFGELNSK